MLSRVFWWVFGSVYFPAPHIHISYLRQCIWLRHVASNPYVLTFMKTWVLANMRQKIDPAHWQGILLKDKQRQSNLIGCLPDATFPRQLIFDLKSIDLVIPAHAVHRAVYLSISTVALFQIKQQDGKCWALFPVYRGCVSFFARNTQI